MREYTSYEGPAVSAVMTGDKVPDSVDVAIVGGGIIGISTALWLSKRGVSVALVEKGTIAAEQSSRNWGWVRIAGRDLRELPMMLRSSALWSQMNHVVEEETGFRKCGILYSAKSQAARDRYSDWAEQAKSIGIDAQILTEEEVCNRLYGVQRKSFGALFTPNDGRAEPQLATSAMARAAIRCGAKIIQNCAVRTIDTAAGRVSGIITERGIIRASTVVIAGGVWSRLLLSGVGHRLPQLKVLSSVYRTAPLNLPIDTCTGFSDFALRKRLDGGYTVASSTDSTFDIVPDSIKFYREFLPSYLVERKSMRLRLGRAFVDEALNWRPGHADKRSIYEAIRVLSPAPDLATLRKVRKSITAALPAFRNVATVQSWGGLIDTTPDAIPVISALEAMPGCYLGTGFAGHGFGIGPAAGEVLADLATGIKPTVDPTPFRYSRFQDGSRLELQSWL